jgi:hypothetical protein
MSFFPIRLLQKFSGFTLAETAGSRPPAEWCKCKGSKGTEGVPSNISHDARQGMVIIFLILMLKVMLNRAREDCG